MLLQLVAVKIHCFMEGGFPTLFRLPQEIRDEIYKYVVLETEDVHLGSEPKIPRLRQSSSTLVQPRYQARILSIASRDGSKARMTTSAPLCGANKQLRQEISDFLEVSGLPVVATVRNFNFVHVLDYLTTPASRPRVGRYTCKEDGTVPQRLVIELSGPYDEHWQQNLRRWIERIEGLLPEHAAELGVLHKTVPWQGRWGVRTPPDILGPVWRMLGEWPVGAGRLELDKVFFTLHGRFQVEVMLEWHAGASFARPSNFGPSRTRGMSLAERQGVYLRWFGGNGRTCGL